MPNAIDLLTQDHEKVRKLLKEFTETTDRAAMTRKRLLSEIKREVEIHAAVEEEIFYAAFRKANSADGAELYHESLEEHRIVEKMVLPDLESIEPDAEEFAGRAKVLREMIEHHAEDEEEDMFPKARKEIGEADLEELGKRMEARKKELKSSA